MKHKHVWGWIIWTRILFIPIRMNQRKLISVHPSCPVKNRSTSHVLNTLQTFSQGKYGRRLYYDHVTRCFVSKCVIQVASVLLCSLILFFPNFNSSIVIWGTLRLQFNRFWNTARDKGKLNFLFQWLQCCCSSLQRTPKTSNLHDIKNSLYPNALKYSEHYWINIMV